MKNIFRNIQIKLEFSMKEKGLLNFQMASVPEFDK